MPLKPGPFLFTHTNFLKASNVSMERCFTMPSPRASGTSTVYVKVEICRGPGLLFFLSDTSRNQLFWQTGQVHRKLRLQVYVCGFNGRRCNPICDRGLWNLSLHGTSAAWQDLSKRGSYSLTSPYSSRWRGSLGLIPDLRKRGSWGAQEVQVGSPCEHVGLTGNGSHRPQKSRVAFSSRGLSFVLSWLQKHARVHLVRTCKCIRIHIHRVSIHIHEAYRVNRCI